ncbi:MAG: TIGR03905 family TSCPD domain-containing protein [Sphaerochaetaceae bacterium]|nr:TIGR03905 family TSCPD domain-containing protein [Sphaerochaetaceae bacterium]
MKVIDFKPQGICATDIKVWINDDDTVADVQFTRGCDGNHKGLVSLCKGMKADEVVSRLKGIRCGMRSSSCPDQLARAIETR